MPDIMQVFWDFFTNNIHVISDNFHVAGWTGLLLTIGRLSWLVSQRVNSFIEKAEETTERQKRMEETIELLATNHLPHIQAAVEVANNKTDDLIEEMRGMRRDILQVVISRK